MQQKNIFFRSPAAILIFVLILTGWIISALYFGHSLFASQKSASLPQLGAVTGELFVSHEWWRLLVSQFLHVHFLHMLFNAMCILILASAIDHKHGWRVLLLIYLVGGLAGQIASVWAYPNLVTDGASQALMALCAGVFILLPRGRLSWFAGLIVAIQVALDVHAIGNIKAGHLSGFVAGSLLSLACLFILSSRHDPA
ncbi:rhomboid family intramembrane serine protease [Undibacterium sp. JH2W]|uniref:rhomboid family intramembrane serine protease n=1 Tax=Undibacterium sp. JH2W TaxID=3413037 RepID=UPI003BF0B428